MANLRKRILDGERIFGTIINVVDHPDIVKIMRSAGFDYIMLDCEHGYMSYDKAASIIAVGKEMDFPVLVRIPCAERREILRYMDMGADGLMLPNTDRAEQARQLVKHAKYSPLGNRGIALGRAHSRYLPISSPEEYMENANEETLLIVQIESTEGIGNIDEIMSVDGIDVAFMGPSDLCRSLGVTGNTASPLYIKAVDRVIDASRKAGKHCGNFSFQVSDLEQWLDKGMTFNMYGNEVFMISQNAKAVVAEMKNLYK